MSIPSSFCFLLLFFVFSPSPHPPSSSLIVYLSIMYLFTIIIAIIIPPFPVSYLFSYHLSNVSSIIYRLALPRELRGGDTPVSMSTPSLEPRLWLLIPFSFQRNQGSLGKRLISGPRQGKHRASLECLGAPENNKVSKQQWAVSMTRGWLVGAAAGHIWDNLGTRRRDKSNGVQSVE